MQQELVYIFGYGSLIWRPGFAYVLQSPARLEGYRRSFCRLSVRHRGTPDKPGMVVGLLAGGECEGHAFGIDPALEKEVLQYLDEREGAGYLRRSLTIQLQDSSLAIKSVPAWTYIANPDHPTFAAHLSLSEKARLLARGRGESGHARDYLLELHRSLRDWQIEDQEIAALVRELEVL